MKVCPVCTGLVWKSHQHNCPPLWIVYDLEDPDNVVEVRARTAQGAACIFAENQDTSSEDYSVLDGSPMRVCVQSSDSTKQKEIWIVRGETVPEYSAEREE